MTTQDHGLARRMWHQLEPLHAVFYYAPEVSTEAATLGYDVSTRWPAYFAWRLAPLGAAGARQAAAACYSFSPRMVAEHVPAAWSVASPAQVLAAREQAVDRMYRALFAAGSAHPAWPRRPSWPARRPRRPRWRAARWPRPSRTCPGRRSRTWCSGTRSR
jgi:hypothetical protein